MSNQNSKLWKLRFNSFGHTDGCEFVISQAQDTRLKGIFNWAKLVAGQGKDGKILYFRYNNSQIPKIELFNIVGADEHSRL